MTRAWLLVLAACAQEPRSTPKLAPAGAVHYAILAAPMAAADGVTSNAVRVVGTQADGSPATDAIVLGTSRPGAGRFAASRLVLGESGAQTAFIACDQTATGCLGPVSLIAALASAPQTPIATVDITLVDPALLDPAKQCRGGGNALYVTGNDQIYTGEATIDASATWSISGFSDQITISVASATDTWLLQFNTSRIQNIAMFPGLYLDATLAYNAVTASQPVGPPGMNIGRNGLACGTITGDFTVLDYQTSNQPTVSGTIVFAQHCEGDPTTALRGCVHVEQP